MNDANRLKEVIQVATDSATFYTRALEKVEDPHVRRVLTDMGQHKRDLIVSLRQSLHIDDATVVPDGVTVVPSCWFRASPRTVLR